MILIIFFVINISSSKYFFLCRVFAENSKKDSIISTGNNQSQKKTLRSQSPAPSLSSATPTGDKIYLFNQN